MNSIVRGIRDFGLDLSLLIRVGGGQASADVAFEGCAAQGPQLLVQNSCDDSAVHDLVTEVHRLMGQAYQEYRNARLCQWTAQLVSPVGSDVRLSVFDQWLLEKLLVHCPHFQLGWTPLQDHPAAFRLRRDVGSLWIQVMPADRSGICCTSVVPVSDVHSMTNAVRGFLDQVIVASVLAEAAD
ncbi:hypothetical protein [Deinococcus aerolatus]|uniref:hypothetical protein n=1 Tax=Deinococcus aerolatus TaxID=522487 RepID=UPI0016629F86|nr:hypothetical protein [Deinococcus aerolatus]